MVGVGFRLWLVVRDVPAITSAEATTGLDALHIAQGVDHPAAFSGEPYRGAAAAYLAAPVVGLAGPSVLALRVPTLLLYAAFLAAIYRLTRRLYSPGLAVATVGLLALGSDRVVQNQLTAGGGYPELLPAGALLMLLAVGLAFGPGAGRARLAGFAGWGLLAGFMLWDDWLILPYLAGAGAVLGAFCRRELLGRAGAALVAGALAGAVPLIAHHLAARPLDDSLSRFPSGVLAGIPLGTGLCAPGGCAPWQLAWGVLYPVLILAAAVLAVRALRRTSDRTERVRQSARLALAVAAGVGLFAYAFGRDPSGLLVSTPAALWPLWTVARRGWRGAVATAALAGLAGALLAATVALVVAVPRIGAYARDQRALVATLDRLHAHRVYADDPTCNRLRYATRERIACAGLADDLGPGRDRWAPARAAVAGEPLPAYALPADSPLDQAFAQRLMEVAVEADVVEVAGYRIYRPGAAVGVPIG